jgi:acetylornithine deacetylase
LRPWLSYDKEKQKANLFCSIPDARGNCKGGIVLSGHTDVVPVDGQDWNSDPFVPTLRDGKLYARGSADMKGFLGLVIEHVPLLLSSALRIPVHLALSFDEEVGCLGAPLMLEELQARGITPMGCIVGEPTKMQVVSSHKGFSAHRCQVRGRAAHSSIPAEGVNAIEYAAQLVTFIKELAKELQERGPSDAQFDVPYSTMQTSAVSGGGVMNTVPDFCEIDFVLRHLPQTDAIKVLDRVHLFANDVLLPGMRACAAGAAPTGISFDIIANAPAYKADESAEVTRLVRKIMDDHVTRKVAYGSEAGLFQLAGIPAIICGPGDIGDAHRANEFIDLSQIQRCSAMLSALTRLLVEDN